MFPHDLYNNGRGSSRAYDTDYGMASIAGGVTTLWDMQKVSSETNQCVVVSETRSIHQSFPALPSVWALSVVVDIVPLPIHGNEAAASGDDVPQLLVVSAVEGLSLITLVIVNVVDDDVGVCGLCLAMITTLPNANTDHSEEYVVV